MVVLVGVLVLVIVVAMLEVVADSDACVLCCWVWYGLGCATGGVVTGAGVIAGVVGVWLLRLC